MARPKSTLGSSRPEKARAIGLSGDFSSLYAAVYNAMHEEDGEASGSSAEFGAASERRFGEALESLRLTDSDTREDALGELIDASVLYWCLRGSLDRPQKVSVVKRRLDKLRSLLVAGITQLDALEEKPASSKGKRPSRRGASGRRGDIDVSYERDFITEHDIRYRAVINDGIVRSRLFELQARQFLKLTLRRLDALLRPVTGLTVSVTRGQPRKYSKDFLLLRCLRLYRRYGRKGGITRRKEGRKEWTRGQTYDGPLVNFIKAVICAVDPSVNLTAKYGLGKSIEDARRLMARHPHVDELVRQNSSDDELLKFMSRCETIRTKSIKQGRR